MAARKKKQASEETETQAVEVTEEGLSKGGSYFTSDEKDIDFIHSGCTLLDMALGGGWALGRMSNIVGDKAAGKTLMSIEACANFKNQYPEGMLWYNEAESAFDVGYAEALGMPVHDIIFINDLEAGDTFQSPKGDASRTIEGLFESLESVLSYCENNNITKGIYVVDSLDGISDRAELDREIDKGTFGASKAKTISELFRRLVSRLEKQGINLMIVSQVRDNIGAMFGAKHTRSGGKALDFYASQIVWLADVGKEKKVINKVERIVGAKIKANVKKNKVGIAYRVVDYFIEFGYGIDDAKTHLQWLTTKSEGGSIESPILSEYDMGSTTFNRKLSALKKSATDEEYRDFREKLSFEVKRIWNTIEEGFLPKRKKY